MYGIDDLFEKRSIVGSRLEELLHKQGITKARFCADAGISRPTLDKLLTGNITNKVNFSNVAGLEEEKEEDKEQKENQTQADKNESIKQAVPKLSLYTDENLPLMKLYRLESVLKSASDRRVWMKSGGYLVIEPTEALTVIDVNTGKYTGKKTPAETILKINLEAAHEVARQLSLRNLSGIIIVDFIDMESKEDQETLMRTLGEELSRDPVKTILVDMTRLGLVEITRKKVRRPLHEIL